LAYGLAIAFALFVWWFSTGAVLYVVGLPRRSLTWSMAAATGMLALALVGLVASSSDESAGGAYCAFTCGLLIWAWHEMSFLTGFSPGRGASRARQTPRVGAASPLRHKRCSITSSQFW
jgi:putative photosynthetic complex assembly protein 2